MAAAARMAMATLKDISRRLGVSVTTVSRALNGFPEVNAETRALVIETARAMNYAPNQFARKLATGRSGMIGYVLKASEELTVDPHFIEMITGLSEAFSARGIDFILHVTDDDDPVTTYRRLIARKTFDGFVLGRPVINDPRVDILIDAGIPFAMHGRVPGDTRYPFYDIDNDAVGYRMTRHLLDLGHRRIAFLNGPTRRAYAYHRQRGHLAALAEAGLQPNPALTRAGLHTWSYGVAAAEEMLARDGAAPTAFICAHSRIAAGVLDVLDERGIAVPEAASVLCHDDGTIEPRDRPPMRGITGTRSILRSACGPLAEFLVRNIAGEPPEALQVRSDPEFVDHGSSGPVPG